jgi:hypothetical protein
VQFTVTAGPNAGLTGTGVTGADGKATYTYTSATAGVDHIFASFTDTQGVSHTSNEATKTWTAVTPPDTTAPSCALTATGTDSSGRKYVEVTVQDSGSGLHSINVTTSTNANTVVGAFTDGSTGAVIVRATKIKQSQGSTIALTATDRAGNRADCDPTSVTLRLRRGLVRQRITRVPGAEHKIRIDNGKPGLKRLTIRVNGRRFSVRMKAGKTVTIDVQRAMRTGNTNTVELVGHGLKRGSATITIHD